jgi:hypothetical protein
MKKEDVQKMTDMMTGRIPRDQKFLDSLPPEKMKEETPPSRPKTAIEREQEQRDFSRMMFGKEAEKRYSRHVEGLPDLK